MSNYADLARHRKRARPLYLELCALGLEVQAKGDADHPPGHRIIIGGLRSLSPAHADRIQRCIRGNEAGLVMLLLGRWDPDLEAVRQEGERC